MDWEAGSEVWRRLERGLFLEVVFREIGISFAFYMTCWRYDCDVVSSRCLRRD